MCGGPAAASHTASMGDSAGGGRAGCVCVSCHPQGCRPWRPQACGRRSRSGLRFSQVDSRDDGRRAAARTAGQEVVLRSGVSLFTNWGTAWLPRLCSSVTLWKFHLCTKTHTTRVLMQVVRPPTPRLLARRLMIQMLICTSLPCAYEVCMLVRRFAQAPARPQRAAWRPSFI